jgi:YjgF/chorismate_mutase-like putative endoribonuclease
MRRMATIEQRIEALGLSLPPAAEAPDGSRLPFRSVHVIGRRAYVSGHGPQLPDGSVAGPLGKVGSDLTVEQGYHAARLTALSILASLKRTLGELECIAAWCRVFGMVNSAPGFQRQPAVINGFSDLILEVFGPDRGAHSRSAVGLAELPFGIPVEVEAELLLFG